MVMEILVVAMVVAVAMAIGVVVMIMIRWWWQHGGESGVSDNYNIKCGGVYHQKWKKKNEIHQNLRRKTLATFQCFLSEYG